MLSFLTKKQIIAISIVIVSLFLFGVLVVTSNSLQKSLDDQRAYERWSSGGDFAQISCFFIGDVTLDFNQIMTFRNQIDKSLREAAFTNTGTRRLYIDAYSSIGTITIRSDRSNLDTAAIGIGGDFFHFHPLKLVSGTYFSGSDLMKDSVILDEEAAWQLFGSSNIAGMPVMIGGVPHYVKGVIAREQGRLWKAAGLDRGVAYVSAETLAEHGNTIGIQLYEVVMPNPVSGFAYRVALENFGYNEEKMRVIDNSTRYSLESLLKVIAETGTRSMQTYAIKYPYWENYARGFEDILALMLVFKFLLLLNAFLISLITLILAYKRRTWTWKAVFIKVWLGLKFCFDFIHKKVKKKRIV